MIGDRVPFFDTVARVSGTLQYTSDLAFAGALHGALVVSPHHHARVLSMDTSAALALPGVACVVTRADAPDTPCSPMPVVIAGKRIAERILLGDEVCFRGETVAAVAAQTADLAQEAAALVRVEWEELPAVFDPIEALDESAPPVRTGWDNLVGNLEGPVLFERGDVDAVFAAADHVVEGTYRTSTVHAGPLEPYGCIVVPDDDGGLTVHKGTPAAFEVRQTLSAWLGLPEDKVRVVTPPTGGSFGSRTEELEFITALLARKSGRPVRLVLHRRQGRPAGRVRHGAVFTVRSALTADGRLLGRTLRAVYDCGGYPDLGRYVVLRAMRPLALYRADALRFEGLLVRTNKPVAAATRGFGNPQATFAVESHNDEIVRELGLDSVEFRVRNGLRSGDENVSVGKIDAAGAFRVRGNTIGSCGLRECLVTVASSLADWSAQPRIEREDRRLSHGYGLAAMMHTSGKGHLDYATARLTLSGAGRLLVETGTSDQGGTGIETTLAMVAAQVLGLELAAVEVRTGDTRLGLQDSGSHASSRTYVAGEAVRRAAVQVEDAREAGEPAPIVRTVRYDATTNAPPFAACGAEVEVDLDTGVVRVTRIVSANDVGRVLNRTACEGQVVGAVAQGIGFALTEEWPSVAGVPVKTAGLLDEKMPRAPDVPRVEVHLIETHEPTGPFGAKGVGEAGLIAVAPAIANAVADALGGVRLRALPMSAERVWRALGGGD